MEVASFLSRLNPHDLWLSGVFKLRLLIPQFLILAQRLQEARRDLRQSIVLLFPSKLFCLIYPGYLVSSPRMSRWWIIPYPISLLFGAKGAIGNLFQHGWRRTNTLKIPLETVQLPETKPIEIRLGRHSRHSRQGFEREAFSAWRNLTPEERSTTVEISLALAFRRSASACTFLISTPARIVSCDFKISFISRTK